MFWRLNEGMEHVEEGAAGGIPGAGEAAAPCGTEARTSTVYDNPLKSRCRVEGAPEGAVAKNGLRVFEQCEIRGGAGGKDACGKAVCNVNSCVVGGEVERHEQKRKDKE